MLGKLTVIVTSWSILAYELIITHGLSVQYWPYFASMVLSLAMLGYGASSSMLHFLPESPPENYPITNVLILAALAMSIPICYFLAQKIPCNPLTVFWNSKQWFWFLLFYVLLSLPFLLGGWLTAWYLRDSKLSAGQIYWMNLAGAAFGILSGLVILDMTTSNNAIKIIGFPLWLVMSFWIFKKDLKTKIIFLLFVILNAYLIHTPEKSSPPMIEYKDLPKFLLLPDAKIEMQINNRYGNLILADSKHFRYAPGLSLVFKNEIPSQKPLFLNGSIHAVLFKSEEPSLLKNFHSHLLHSLPYQIINKPDVLLTGPGLQISTAWALESNRIEVLESNPLVLNFLSKYYKNSGIKKNSSLSRIKIHGRPEREFISKKHSQYDIVSVPFRQAPFASATGASANIPDYLLTEQGIESLLSLLKKGGVLSIQSWLNIPPRDEIKIIATISEAMKNKGIKNPKDHIIALRSLRTGLILAFPDILTPPVLTKVKSYCGEMGFDIFWSPGITQQETNTFNYIPDSPHYGLTKAMLTGNQDSVMAAHIYKVNPAHDNSPYFSQFLKFRALPQFLKLSGPNSASHIGWGYLFLWITFFQIIPLGGLILWTPIFLGWNKYTSNLKDVLKTLVFFGAIGFGYMVFEISIIQQFSRWISHPLSSFALTLILFLSGSGLGSYFQNRWQLKFPWIFKGLILTAGIHFLIWILSLYLDNYILFQIDLIAVAALAVFLGMPFPWAMESLRKDSRSNIPIAWAANGFFSVFGVLTAGLVSISINLSVNWVLGMACYLIAYAIHFRFSKN